MAAITDTNNSENTEMKRQASVHSLDLSDFVTTYDLPQCVCITEGSFLSREVQITVGDVLLLKSCNKRQVVLSFRDEGSHAWKEASVDLDYPQKFHVLPPKDTTAENRTASVVMYPTVSDLILDCPTYFEATASYEDSILPGNSVTTGDQFWFVGLTQWPEGGVERLKVRDQRGEVRFLSLDCRGNFYHLKDDNEYTVRELVELAAVQRRLKLVNKQSNLEGKSDHINKLVDSELFEGEYTAVNKTLAKSRESLSSTSSQSSSGAGGKFPLPESFSGIVHLLKFESTVAASPYDEQEVTWEIPLSANLKVRLYSHSDYEVPAPRLPLSSHNRVPLPLLPNDGLPKFQAPLAPPLQQPLVPMNISNFLDIYCSSFPVKAQVVDTAGADPFFQEMLKGIDEVIIYRMEEAKRLYVKDAKADIVYGLSHDVALSFVEYPEKFQTVSDLLHLPVGTEVTVLEDIAADFPKPFSLRFGDIIRLVSNTPYFVKIKHANRDCEVIKCERIDPDGGENTKLKLPMDFEVSMVMTIDSNNRKMITLQDLLSGAVPIPNQTVASVISDSESTSMKELPIDLRILRPMKETCLVAASATARKFPSRLIPNTPNLSKSGKTSKEKAVVSCSPLEPAFLTNIGLPVTSGIVLAFRDRLDLCELDVVESEADYIRLPLEKMTLSQFEERERMRKLNSDYEDVEFSSSSTIDECGAGGGTIARSGSLGVIDRKQKSTKMDKVLRFSRALNPKHWRHSKSEPEPLPHPSAMGLMALAAREKDDISNEYQHTRLDSSSSKTEAGKDGFSASGISISSSDEEENFYEDVEIGPIKSSTINATTARQTGAFSGPTHRSLPPRMQSKLFARQSNFARETVDNTSTHAVATPEETDNCADKRTDNSKSHIYDVPSPLSKVRSWATNIGNNFEDKFSIKPRYDVPKSSKVQSSTPKKEKVPVAKTNSAATIDRQPPDMKPPKPPIVQTDSNPPIPPSRRKRGKTTQQNIDSKVDENTKKEQKNLASITLDESKTSNNDGIPTPKPKPRGLKQPESFEVPKFETQTSLNAMDKVKAIEPISVGKQTSAVSSSYNHVKDNLKPKPPPKPKMSTHTTV